MSWIIRSNIATFLSVIVIICGQAGISPAFAQQVSYTGSAQYATGDYFFTERTGSFYLNNGLTVSSDMLTLSINVPFIAQNSPWISYSSSGPLPTGGPGNESVGNNAGPGHSQRRGGRRINPGNADTVSYTSSSLGDPTLSGNVQLYRSNSLRTFVQGNMNLKFPLADPNSGFGTGAWDFGAGFSVSQRLGDRMIAFADVMYWRLGDMSDLDFKNPLSYSFSLGHTFASRKLLVAANFYGYTQILEDIDPPLSTGLNFMLSVWKNVQLNTNLTVGLSESASDFSGGFGWNIQL